MEKRVKGYLYFLLEDYPNYETHVKQRKLELMYPYVEPDDNVGGGKAQNKPSNPLALRMLISTEQDNRLNSLDDTHYKIKACYEDASTIAKIICNELYFKKYNLRTAESIDDLVKQDKIHAGRSKAYKDWADFLDQLAATLGLPVA